jgi:hypothetical protein
MDATPTSNTSERVERLLRDAHLLRMRQQWGQAETLCRQALELSPDDVLGRELLADLLALWKRRLRDWCSRRKQKSGSAWKPSSC